jgi:hypothetical protein
MKNCETLHPVLYLFFLFFKMFINFGREEQCMTSSNMYICTYLLFCDVLWKAQFMQQKYLELRTYLLHKIHNET